MLFHVNAQTFDSNAELAIPTGRKTNKASPEIETYRLTADAKIKNMLRVI